MHVKAFLSVQLHIFIALHIQFLLVPSTGHSGPLFFPFLYSWNNSPFQGLDSTFALLLTTIGSVRAPFPAYPYHFLSCLAYSSTLKTEAAQSSETSENF
jgi:hypothetical protein